VYLTIGGIN
jgi:hypothetical protein